MCILVGDGKPKVFVMHNLAALKQTTSAYAVGIKLDITGPAYPQYDGKLSHGTTKNASCISGNVRVKVMLGSRLQQVEMRHNRNTGYVLIGVSFVV